MMKVRIDTIPVTLIGERKIDGDPRYYYTHAGYPRLLICSHRFNLYDFGNRFAVALFESVDSRIVCDVLPDAPHTQCIVKVVKRLPHGAAVSLSEALRRNAEKYGYGGE